MKKTADPTLITELEKLPPRAWLRRSTWARLLGGAGSQPAARVGGSVRPARRTATLPDGSLSVHLGKADEWPDFPLAGLVATTDTARWWSVPPWVHHAPPGGPRLSTLEGSPVYTSRLMATGLTQVPGLVATLEPDGSWATSAAPGWVAIAEADVGTAYPPLVSSPGPVLLTWLLPTFAYLKAPTNWARR